MKSKEHLGLLDECGVKNYDPLPFVMARGRGARVWDVESWDYLDMNSCYSALNAGHCHPRIVKAAIEQLRQLGPIARGVAFHDQLGPAQKELAEFCGKEKVLLMNTGAEAWETAVKAIRKWAYTVKGIPRYGAEIIVCKNNFHGRTVTAISASSEPHYRDSFGPYTPGFKSIPFADIKALKRAIKINTAAFVVEPIQAEAGIIMPPDGYLREAKNICAQNNVMFVLDEIQTGLGRTGKHFAWQWEDANPDLLLLGKFLGGGIVPVSAVMGPSEILCFEPGEHGSTFSGYPLACAVLREVIRVIKDEGLSEKARESGLYLLEKLGRIHSPYVKEVRGRGLLIGIELYPQAGGARKFVAKLMEEGVMCSERGQGEIRGRVLGIAPPLVITRDEIDWGLEKIEKVLNED